MLEPLIGLAVALADIIQPDICVVGGVSEMRRIAAIAEAHYLTIAPHNPMGPLATAVNIHFCAAQPNFKILEYKPHVHAPWPLDPYIPVDGHMELRPDRRAGAAKLMRQSLLKRTIFIGNAKSSASPMGQRLIPESRACA